MGIKYQACNICNALLRNINDNFKSVSFDFIKGKDIQIKIILEKRTEIEDGYIEDMITEFTSLQESNCVPLPIVEIGDHHWPLQNLVYNHNEVNGSKI